jgi:hypothetical protein
MLLGALLIALQLVTPLPSPPVPSPSPSAQTSATPSPTPSPSPGFSVHGTGVSVFIDQATSGSGATPPEGPGFAIGNPNAPMSPYDWFSGAPEVPGVAGEIQYQLLAAYRAASFTATAAFVISGIDGNATNAIYWGEPIVGPLDPHEGRSPIPYAIAFPTHAGTQQTQAGQIVLPYSLSLSGNDGTWSASGGFITPAAFDGFIFTPPALTSWLPSLNVQTLESLSPGNADLDSWQHLTTTLPLLGADATAAFGKLGLEVTDALLPSPAGTAARFNGAVATLDRGDVGKFSLDYTHVDTWGNALAVPTLYGFNPTLHPGAQGDLATSTLADQHETIFGGRAFFHPIPGYDTTIELAQSSYNAGLVARPGTQRPGYYQHFAIARHFNKEADAGIEYYRFDPRYATAVLPYGVSENVWGIAWAYPGPWLKGTYQLANDNVAGTNRLGLRAHADLNHGKLEAHVSYYAYRQVEPSTYDNLTQSGFVEVDYLTEAPGDVTYGQTHGVAAYLGWHLPRDTFSVDFARDTQSRGYNGANPGDLVDMRYPQVVLIEQHRFSPQVLAVAGYGRYGADGMWSTTPVTGIYGLGFVGGEFAFDGGRQQILIELRRYGLVGLPSIPAGPPPTLGGTSLIVDHHIAF